MSEIVLVTEKEYRKAKDVFASADGLEARPAPADEAALAVEVARSKCRAVILGVEPYAGPLYDALEANGGGIMARFGVGHDGVDKALARAKRIVVTNTPGALDRSVAELTFWMIGAFARRVAALDARFRRGEFPSTVGFELCGRSLGVLGFGAIGRQVAAIAARGFGMRVLAADCRCVADLEEIEGRSFSEIEKDYALDLYTPDVEVALARADVISIHLPSNAETRRFINAERLARMKPEALIVNIARGPIVDEAALYDALAAGRIGGAALDVFETEPYVPVAPDKDLRTLDNIVLTSHVGSNTREANDRMARGCLRNIAHYFAGEMDRLNRVDG